jgi:hypothetical protein
VPLPTDQEILETAERQPAAVGVLAAGALIGGFALGAAFTESVKQGWIEEPKIPDAPTQPQAWGEWVAGNVALVMAGYSLREAMVEMGRDEFLRQMGLFSGAVVAMKIVSDAVRKARGK